MQQEQQQQQQQAMLPLQQKAPPLPSSALPALPGAPPLPPGMAPPPMPPPEQPYPQLQPQQEQDKAPLQRQTSRDPRRRPSLQGAAQPLQPQSSRDQQGTQQRPQAQAQDTRDPRRAILPRPLSARKLALVLDVDHTLLNSVKEEVLAGRDGGSLMQAARARLDAETRRPPEERTISRHDGMGILTKLRPFVRRFLAQAATLFELHLVTMGRAEYAEAMAALLDPRGELFGAPPHRRVRSREGLPRGDDGAEYKDLSGVDAVEAHVLLVDDTAEVWPAHGAHLVVVERYAYFPHDDEEPGVGRSKSLLRDGVDESASAGQLVHTLDFLRRVHARAFADLDAATGSDTQARSATAQRAAAGAAVDATRSMCEERNSLLAGVTILFSRLIPLGEPNPEKHELWRLATELGARCLRDEEKSVTHVVAASSGTSKVAWARGTGRAAVSPDWLRASRLMGKRMDEKHFSLK
jgi:RNA polymerase II C-terminal domain phosphatase-like 3/4